MTVARWVGVFVIAGAAGLTGAPPWALLMFGWYIADMEYLRDKARSN